MARATRGGGIAQMTPLDQAHDAMENAPADDAARLRFYDRLAGTELFFLLASHAGRSTSRGVASNLFAMSCAAAKAMTKHSRRELLAMRLAP